MVQQTLHCMATTIKNNHDVVESFVCSLDFEGILLTLTNIKRNFITFIKDNVSSGK